MPFDTSDHATHTTVYEKKPDQCPECHGVSVFDTGVRRQPFAVKTALVTHSVYQCRDCGTNTIVASGEPLEPAVV